MPLSSLYSPVLMPDSPIISPHLQDSALAHVEEGLTVFQYFSSVLSSEPPKLVPVINLSFVLKKRNIVRFFLSHFFCFFYIWILRKHCFSFFPENLKPNANTFRVFKLRLWNNDLHDNFFANTWPCPKIKLFSLLIFRLCLVLTRWFWEFFSYQYYPLLKSLLPFSAVMTKRYKISFWRISQD